MADRISVETVLAKALEAAAMRQRITANNLANVDTPGFRAREVKFEEMLGKALESGDAAKLAELSPEILVSEDAAVGADGNSVTLEREVAQMVKNSLMYKMYMRLLQRRYRKLEMAIFGK